MSSASVLMRTGRLADGRGSHHDHMGDLQDWLSLTYVICLPGYPGTPKQEILDRYAVSCSAQGWTTELTISHLGRAVKAVWKANLGHRVQVNKRACPHFKLCLLEQELFVASVPPQGPFTSPSTASTTALEHNVWSSPSQPSSSSPTSTTSIPVPSLENGLFSNDGVSLGNWNLDGEPWLFQ